MSQESLLEGGLLSWIKKEEEEEFVGWEEGHSSQRGSMNQGAECERRASQVPRLEVSVRVRSLVP